MPWRCRPIGWKTPPSTLTAPCAHKNPLLACEGRDVFAHFKNDEMGYRRRTPCDSGSSRPAELSHTEHSRCSPACGRPMLTLRTCRQHPIGGHAMSKLWDVMDLALGDAGRAENLMGDVRTRRTLRNDPERALRMFELYAQEIAESIAIRKARGEQ